MTPVPTRTVLTAAIAAGIILTTGPTGLAWVSNKPGAPQSAVIDQIINSAKMAIRAPAPAPAPKG
jgi:hypothetical protein